MENSSNPKKQAAERMLSLFYRNGEKPSAEFLADLEQMIEGNISEEEMRSKIISRHKQ